MNKKTIIIFGFLLLLISGSIFVFNKQNTQKKQSSQIQKILKISNTPGKPQGPVSVLADKTSRYEVFTTAAFTKAQDTGKTIFLEFYASWCPICRAQEPKLIEGFNALNDPNVIGFRVNYNDPQTADSEKKLATDYGVKYQHTHVILKDGKVVSTSTDPLDKDSFLSLVKGIQK